MADPLDLEWQKASRPATPADRFVQAALRLVASGDSFDEVSVAAIAKEAGTSVGAFYSRFADKRELLHQLQIELYREAHDTAARAFEVAANVPVPLETLVRSFVEFVVSTSGVQRGLRRAFLVEMARDLEFRARATALARHTCAGLVECFARHFPAADRERLTVVVDVVHRLVYAVLDQRLLFGAESPTGRDVSDDEIARELTMAAVAYLTAALA